MKVFSVAWMAARIGLALYKLAGDHAPELAWLSRNVKLGVSMVVDAVKKEIEGK